MRGGEKICLDVLPVFISSLLIIGCGGSDGKNGENGINGTNSTIQTNVEPAGVNCSNGGIKIDVLQDGVVQEEQTQYICNGNNGAPGQSTNGTNGTSASIQTSDEPAGENCPNGGVKIEVLLDGIVQDAQTKYICNGTNGKDGHNGCASGYHYEEHMNTCVPDGFIGIPAGSYILTHSTLATEPSSSGGYQTYYSGNTITLKAFALSKTPVTVAEFRKCYDAGACSLEHFNSYSSGSQGQFAQCNGWRGDKWLNHPMNCIDWNGAKEYCRWLGGRLPSETEWEYAATHNGTERLNTKYSFGDTLEHCVNANYADSGASGLLSETQYCDGTQVLSAGEMVGTSAVGTYSPAGDSPLGLVDMTGNVYEWTESRYSSPSSSERIIKGGAWYTNTPRERLVTYQRQWSSSSMNSDVGIRCAIDIK